MNASLFALLSVVLLASAVIAGMEFYDRRQAGLNQQIIKDGISVAD